MVARCSPLDGDDDELALQAAGFAALLEGAPVTAAELGRAATIGVERAEAARDRLLARETLLATEDGRIDGIAGLSLRPTRHELELDGTSIHTWCAFDSVGIPAAFEADATARTDCGHCGAAIEVRFEAGLTGDTEHSGWMPELDPDETALITNFCSKADLFCSRAHLDDWYEASGRPNGDPCSMGELLEMGRVTWQHCVP